LLIWIGLFMGTVMGVVQVVVQSASGLQRLGEAAASVQVSGRWERRSGLRL
jgi:hypothetical protein